MNQFTFAELQCPKFETMHLKALCSSLSQASQLQSLDLTFDGRDQLLNTLIPALSRLTSLNKIYLNLEEDNQIQAETIFKLFMTFSTIKSLIDITLLLCSCEIVSENASTEPVSEGLQNLNASSIRKLALDLYKNLTDEGLAKISQALKKFTSLEKLRVDVPDSPEITDEGLAQLSSAIRDLSSLTSLTLNFSGFTEDLALAFTSLQNLAHLKLSFQNPEPSQGQVQQLSSSLKDFKSSLRFLDITFAKESSLPDSMIESFSETLKELTLLKHLSLNFSSASSLTSEGVEALSSTIQGLSSLSSLSLNLENNKGVDEKAVIALSEIFKSLPSLYSIELNLEECDQIDPKGSGLQSLFITICEMKNLWKLDLNFPSFSYPRQELMKLKERLTLYIHEGSNCLAIRNFMI